MGYSRQDRQTDRQADRQTGRQADRHKHILFLITFLDLPFSVEAPRWVFNQLRSQKTLVTSSEKEEDKTDRTKQEGMEDKVTRLEVFFQAAKLEVVASATQQATPCLVHSGSVRLMRLSKPISHTQVLSKKELIVRTEILFLDVIAVKIHS